ncbi:kinesin [Penicillium coprophilum]|uniref:kinesin n=1 Tax=Penicillium coprophilum TaxID=36646 RepID=UPI0023A58980|nr:kinesin [Penicillium coprophilum]KAJ5164408.1 kinesin [Penicillium coprophilum]
MSSNISFGDGNYGIQVGINSGVINAQLHLPPSELVQVNSPERSAADRAETPETPPLPFSTVPFIRDPDFIDRQGQIDQIDRLCATPSSRVALVGLGGIGKSQLAIEYSYRVREKSPNVWVFWIHASNAARFKQSYEDLSRRAKIPGYEDPNVNVFELVHDWLLDSKRGKWIMILDNIDDDDFLHARPSPDQNIKHPLITYIPRYENGSVILTTRNKQSAWKVVNDSNVVHIEPDELHARALIHKKLRLQESEEDIRSLAETLEYMPLAIVQAVAYMAHRAPRRTIQQYLEQFQKSERRRIKLLEHQSGNPQRDWEASNSILITWQISFDYIQQARKSAADLLSLMSFFDRQGIPEYVLHDDKKDEASSQIENNSSDEDDGEDSDSDDDEIFENDLVLLRNYSFVTVGEEKIFAMHALVQLATRNWLDFHGGIEAPKARFVHNLCRDFPGGGYEYWEKYQALFPHVKAAASMSKRPASKESIMDWAFLLYKSAWYAWRSGDLAEMKRMAEKSRSETQKVLPAEHEQSLACASREDEHQETLTSMANLALTYDNLGRLQDAEALHLEVLDTRKKVLGDRHEETLHGMNNLGNNYWLQGQWKKAENIHMQVLEVRRDFGEEDPDNLTTTSNLARSYDKQERFEDAEVLHKRVLESRKKLFSEEHPDVLTSMNNLGMNFLDQGRFGEAGPLFMKAVEGRRNVLGEDHLDTINSMEQLVVVYRKQENWADSQTLLKQLLETLMRVFGEDHPRTLNTTNKLGFSYWVQGQYREAEELFKRSHEGFKRVYGEEDPRTLSAMSNLASSYRRQSRWLDAEPLDRKVFECRSRTLGATDVDTVLAMFELAVTCKNLGRMQEATQLAMECVTIQILTLMTKIPKARSAMPRRLGHDFVVARR